MPAASQPSVAETGTVYTADERGNSISVIDLGTGKVRTVPIGTSAGRLVYASNAEDNTLSIVDVKQRKVVGEIKTGKGPHGLRMSPDGREIYVANTGDNSVSVIDTATQRVTRDFKVGDGSGGITFKGAGR